MNRMETRIRTGIGTNLDRDEDDVGGFLPPLPALLHVPIDDDVI